MDVWGGILGSIRMHLSLQHNGKNYLQAARASQGDPGLTTTIGGILPA